MTPTPIRKHPLKHFLILALSLLLLIGLIDMAISPKSIPVEMVQVKRATFHEIIRTDGTLRSKQRHTVSAFADGDIKRIDLKVGDEIKKGEIITELFWDMRYEPLMSPMEGVISRVFRESAGPIHRGEPLIELINPRRLEVVIELLTPDAARVSQGDQALIENWGGDQALKAQVRKISKAGFTKSSALGVEEERTEVILDLNEIPQSIGERLGSSFHVDVALEVSTTPQALIIPEGALFRDASAWAIYQVLDHQARRRRVSVLRRSEGWAHIGEEMNEGDWVIVYPSDLLKEGAQVKPLSQ